MHRVVLTARPLNRRRPVGWLAVLPAVLAVLAGIWVAGGVVTDDARASMALTALWFAAVVVLATLAWRRAPSLRPAAAAAVLAFVAVGGYLAYTSTVDTTVSETLVDGPAVLEGSFGGLAHPTEGTAAVVERAGERTLTLAGFRTDPGPDLYVYVVPGRVAGGSVDGGVRLARLKGNVGDQQYALPASLDLADGATVVIWCRAFSVAFGAAQLTTDA